MVAAHLDEDRRGHKGGEITDDPQVLGSYALYFSKYIQTYCSEGIHLFAVMPQNEPLYNNNVYPQAVWSGALMNIFLRDYLVPRLRQDKLSIEVWQGTIVNEIIEDTSHFAGSYFYWNTVLKDDEPSTWGWCQNSLLTVDCKTKQVRYNPAFYSMKHFAANVLPWAKRIAVSGGPISEIVASANRDGSQVLEFENDSEQPLDTTLQTGGRPYRLHVPAKSMNTVTLSTQGIQPH